MLYHFLSHVQKITRPERPTVALERFKKVAVKQLVMHSD